MPDLPSPLILPRQPSIHIASPESEMAIGLLLASLTSTTLTANRCNYFPFRLWRPERVRQLFVHNGATASGNVDIGIYDYGLNKIASSGSTAQSGTSVLQYFDIADINLGPGLYYWGFAMDNGTGTVMRNGGIDNVMVRAYGCALQASTFPLPSTATFASAAGASNFAIMLGMVTGRG